MGLLYKLLKQNVSILQITAFLAVNLLGALIVLLGVGAYCSFRSIDSAGSSLSSSSVVINKALPANATINSLLGKSPTFSDDEIEELEEMPSIASVGCFVASRFEVGALLSIASAGISTDIFLEAIPDEFVVGNYTPVDGVPCSWEGGVDAKVVPVIIPRNYLNLYNFGYAASSNLPQISDDMVGYLPLTLVVETGNGRVRHNAVIYGLTDKFNTILVPWKFLNEANALYAPGVKEKPSRLMLTTNASEFDEATLDFLSAEGYVIEGDATPVRLQNFIYGLIYIIVAVGALFSLLAFVLLVISILLLIEKNREKITNLYSIGYSATEISKIYRNAAFVADVAMWLLAAVVATCVYPLLADILRVVSQGNEAVPLVFMWGVAISSALMFAIMHSCIIFVNIKKHCV